MDFKAFIEIPAGSSVKYEVDEETGNLTVDRFLYTAFTFPFNYGHIPNTLADDGDPLDIVVLAQGPVVPGVFIKCHAVGLLDMEDEKGIDTKIIATPDQKIDPVYGVYQNIEDISQPILDKIKHFFENYKTLEPGKWVKVRDFKGREEAEKAVTASQKAS